MIQIPVHNQSGEQVDAIEVDEQLLGGELRPVLLKQAYVRYHANRRLGNAKTKRRGENAYSTRKLYRQKGTGNARRGSAGTNLMRGGGHGFAKSPRSWRQDMPIKMRRLANRNALLAKIVDDEIKIIDNLKSDTFYWTVCSVDAEFARSAWAAEQSFDLIDSKSPELGGVTMSDTGNAGPALGDTVVELKTYLYDSPNAPTPRTPTVGPGLPASFDVKVKTTYADFSTFTTTTNGDPPSLAHNPFIGNSPLDPTPA